MTATIFLILFTIPLWSGCTAITGFNDLDFSSDGDGDGDSDGDADGDSDGDADGDSDGDADGDSDGDADGDSDGDADGDGDCDPEPEVCNGVDDNCNGEIDETFPGIGEVCGSSEGECMPGARACVNGSEVCEGEIGPTEDVCDGLDNDCDGSADTPFTCALNQTTGCMGDLDGCHYLGFEHCNADCNGWSGVCEPPEESCNRVDDNCDGLVDESLLMLSPATEAYPTYGAELLSTLRADYHPVDDQYLALWLAPIAANGLHAVAVNPDGMAPSSYEVIYTDVVDADICFDGTEFTVVYITDMNIDGLNDVVAARINTSLMPLESYIISNNYPNTSEPTQVRCAHTTDTAGDHFVGVTWNREKESSGSEDWLMFIAIEAGTSTSSWYPIAGSRAVLEETVEQSVQGIAIEGLDNGRFMIAAEIEDHLWSPGDGNEVVVRVVGTSGSAIANRAYDGGPTTAQRDLEIAYDPSSNRAAILYQYFTTAPTNQFRWVSVNTTDLSDADYHDLGTSERAVVANAGDSSFGFLTFHHFGSSPRYVFTRYAPDGTMYAETYDLSLDVGSIFLVGVPAGDERYAAFALEPPVADMQLVHNAIRCP